MIKVVNLVSLLAAPIIVKYDVLGPGKIIAIILIFLVISWAFLQSKQSVEVAHPRKEQEISEVKA